MFKIKEFYKKFGFSLVIYSDNEEDDYNILRINFIYPDIWLHIPKIINAKKEKCQFLDKNETKYYFHKIEKQYGFNFSDFGLHIYYGIQPGQWIKNDPKNSDHSKFYDYFWDYKSAIRWDYYDVFGNYICDKKEFDEKREKSYYIKDNKERFKYEEFNNMYKYYTFNDSYDNEELIAKVNIEEMEWRRGINKFWKNVLKYFCKPLIIRSINIHFNKEFGKKKSSWKGGIIEMSFNMLPNENIDECWERFLKEENK